MKTRTNNLLIGIYFHPEAYPPTLNAVGELSECFDHITIVHRPHLHSSWKYPLNVDLVASGRFILSKQQEAASLLKKISFFVTYLLVFVRRCLREKPAVILVYDSMSLYAYHLTKKMLPFKHIVWYHNHDVVERKLLRRFSIGWFAANAELKAFRYLDIFSLPTNDRLQYFPMDVFKGQYFFIPNFPSKKFYGQFYKPQSPSKMVKIIFQGQVAPFRGIEQIIPLLAEPVEECEMLLGLIGPCNTEYKASIVKLCETYNVSSKVYFDRLPYAKLPELTSAFHIGIALLTKGDIMTTTIGTASNKLYEYAALGLPVIYYNSENLTRHLKKYRWAFPADADSSRIKERIVSILASYDKLSASAYHDFMEELNFEKGFAEVKSCLQHFR